jgi:hypothetical protein
MPADDSGAGRPDDEPSFLRPPRWSWDRLLRFINLDGLIECFELSEVEEQWVGRWFPDREGDEASELEFVYHARKPKTRVIERTRTTKEGLVEHRTEWRQSRGRWTKRRRTTKRHDESRFGVLEDQCLFRIAGSRFVLFFLEYGEPEREGEPVVPLLGRELCHKDASFWFALKEIKPPPPLKKLVPTPDPSQDPTSRLNRDWKPAVVDLPTQQSVSKVNLQQEVSPDSAEAPVPRDPPVVLANPDEPVLVWGKKKPPLPPAQYRVVKALVKAKASGERLSKDELCSRTKDAKGNVVEDPVGALKRLRSRDPDWRNVIDMAETPGRGYSLRDHPPTPT